MMDGRVVWGDEDACYSRVRERERRSREVQSGVHEPLNQPRKRATYCGTFPTELLISMDCSHFSFSKKAILYTLSCKMIVLRVQVK